MESSFSEKQNGNYGKRLFDVLLWCSIAVYLFVLASLLLFKTVTPLELFSQNRYVFRSVNLVPLAGIFQYLFGNVASFNIAIYNVLGNILLFIPMGLLLQLMRPQQSLLRTVVIVGLTSVGVETVQFILGIGAADIDDVILNTLGGLTGALIFSLLQRIIKNRVKIRILVSTIAMLCAIVVVATQGKVWIRYYFQEQINAGLTEKYGMNLEQADIYGIYESFDGNTLTLMTDDGQIKTVTLDDDPLISFVRRNQDGEIYVFEPIDIETLTELIPGLPIWMELSGTDDAAIKICLGDNPV